MMQEKQQCSKQQEASWAQVLRHMTVVRRTLRTGWSCLQLPGGSMGISGSPPFHEPRRGQHAPTASDQVDIL